MAQGEFSGEKDRRSRVDAERSIDAFWGNVEDCIPVVFFIVRRIVDQDIDRTEMLFCPVKQRGCRIGVGKIRFPRNRQALGLLDRIDDLVGRLRALMLIEGKAWSSLVTTFSAGDTQVGDRNLRPT